MSFFRKPIFIILIIAVIIIVAAIFFFSRDKEPVYNTVTAERKSVVQEVSVTGRVKPAQSVELAFEKGGKVAGVYVAVGEAIFAGRVLAELENSEIAAQLAQAEAGIESAEAKLSQENNALENAKKNLIDQLQDAYTKADDAIRNRVDQFFDSPRSDNPQLSFTINDSQLEIDVEWGRRVVESTFTSWKASLDKLNFSNNLNTYLNEATINLSNIKSFLDKAALAVNGAQTGLSLTQTTIDGWKSNTATARTNVNTAVNNITAAEDKIKTAESNITLQQAAIKEAGANADYYRSQLAKTIIRAPIRGVVTKQDAKVGEIVSANTSLVSLISAVKFEIEANVPEADIAKVKIDDKAAVTLDAYGNEVVFDAEVVKIDPAETVIEGVSTYKTTFQFLQDDERIKSGMTANIDVLTDRRDNVIAVPYRSVITKDGEKLVKVLSGENVEERKVITGLRGSDGNIEIIEGIIEGEKVIIF